MNRFWWWPLIFAALPIEVFLAFPFCFSPGWANGWPFGLTIHTVWSSVMASLISLMFMTVMIGLGGAIGSIWLRHPSGLRYAERAFVAWLALGTLSALIIGWRAYRLLYADTLEMWPNGYNP